MNDSAESRAKLTAEEFSELARRGVPMGELLDIRTERLERGRARLRLPYIDMALRPGGVISGPALMALADMTMYALVLGAIGPREMAVTTDINMHFLRKAPASDVIAEGRLLKLGRRLAVCEVHMYAEGDDRPVTHATGTYAIPD